MKKVQNFQLSQVAVATLLLAGLTGCVAQPLQSTAAVPTADASSSPSTHANTKRSATPDPTTGNPSTASSVAANQKAEKTQPSAESSVPARVVSKNEKPPKTWPEKSRNSNASEKAATTGFIDKSEKMASPNFGKKLQSPDAPLPSVPDYSAVAKGAALGELKAQFMEYATSNWKQTGEISIVGEPKVEDLVIDDVVTHRVYLCIDSSRIQVTESDGFVVTPTAKPGTRTALNIYDLQEQNGQLLVVNHSFPEDPDC